MGSMLSLNCGTPNQLSTKVIFWAAPLAGAVVGAASLAGSLAAGAAGAAAGAAGRAGAQAANRAPADPTLITLNTSRRESFFIRSSP